MRFLPGMTAVGTIVALTRVAGATEPEANPRSGAHFVTGSGVEVLGYVTPLALLAQGDVGVSFGVAPYADMRITVNVAAGDFVQYRYEPSTFVVKPTVLIAAHFKCTKHYGIWVALDGGAVVLQSPDSIGDGYGLGAIPMFAPMFSASSFRFGPREHFELDIWGGAFLHPFGWWQNSISFRYLAID